MRTMHHLDTATLLAYAAGSLDDCLSVVAACHVAMCGHCRVEVRRAEAIGGALLDTAGSSELSSGSLKQVMTIIETGDMPNSVPNEDPMLENNICRHGLPRPLARLLNHDFDQLPWKTAAPGIMRYEIERQEGGSQLHMLKIRAGQRLPDHGHGGQEMTLVLRGAYQDEIGRFSRGDVADLDVDIEHKPVVDQGEDCVCVVATEAPVRFKGIVPRLLQPFIHV